MLEFHEVKVYRAMSVDEFEVLVNQGFAATFKRRWKYFTLELVYIGIILDELDYGLWKDKYRVVVEFIVTFKLPLKKLVEMGLVRVLGERGFTNIAMSRGVLGYIESISWTRLHPDDSTSSSLAGVGK